MDRSTTPPTGVREAPTWDLVLKRNAIERLKQERFPLEIRDDFPRLIAQGYETLPEEDVVRLQWYGLYHDKPKTGYFMLRVKVPGGVLGPARRSYLPARTCSSTGSGWSTCPRSSPRWTRPASTMPVAAATPCATSPPAPWPG